MLRGTNVKITVCMSQTVHRTQVCKVAYSLIIFHTCNRFLGHLLLPWLIPQLLHLTL